MHGRGCGEIRLHRELGWRRRLSPRFSVGAGLFGALFTPSRLAFATPALTTILALATFTAIMSFATASAAALGIAAFSRRRLLALTGFLASSLLIAAPATLAAPPGTGLLTLSLRGGLALS